MLVNVCLTSGRCEWIHGLRKMSSLDPQRVLPVESNLVEDEMVVLMGPQGAGTALETTPSSMNDASIEYVSFSKTFLDLKNVKI